MLNILLEISFDISSKSIYSYKKLSDTEYSFESEGNSYIVEFIKKYKKSSNEEFYERRYHLRDIDSYDLTKEGKAIKVMATVTAITLDFMKKNKDWKIIKIFPVNQKRYNILKKFFEQPYFNNYFIDEIDNEEFDIRKKIKK